MKLNFKKSTYILIVTLGVLFLSIGCNSGGNENFVFKVSEKFDPKLMLTFYKTSKKIAVKGGFNDINFEVNKTLKSQKISTILETITFSIPTKGISTNNPDRDKKISEHFFNKMSKTDIIYGKVVSLEGDNTSGKCDILIIMNEVEQTVTFNYTVTNQTMVSLDAEIELSNWKALSALDSLNQVCSQLHMSEDLESVLWPDVSIKIECSLEKVKI